MLSNELLLESYYTAMDMELEDDFIKLLLAEIHKRRLWTAAS